MGMTVDRRDVKLVESLSVANLSELVGPKVGQRQRFHPDLGAHMGLQSHERAFFCPSVQDGGGGGEGDGGGGGSPNRPIMSHFPPPTKI